MLPGPIFVRSRALVRIIPGGQGISLTGDLLNVGADKVERNGEIEFLRQQR
jgi:hypothetical protein